MDMEIILWFLLGLVCCVEGMTTLAYSNLVKVAVLGVEFFLRGRFIPTDDSGRLLITDISFHNRQTSTSDEEALICLSNRNVGKLLLYSNAWYLDPEVKTTKNTVGGEIISEESNDRGWTVNRDRMVKEIHFIE